MANRYFSAEIIESPNARLTGSEAHHLLHVMRARPGLEVVLFDGRGGEFPAEVTRCSRAEVELAVGPRRDVERELSFHLILAAPLPKGDRQRWLVEKAVELGVCRLVPLRAARSECVQDEPPAKLKRHVIEASKQCGRNRLMEIAAPVKWSALVGETSLRRLVAHPGGQPVAQIPFTPPADSLVAVGPEGGLTDAELARAAEAGWQVVGLGDRLLRVETAAIALVSKLAMA